MYEFHEYAYVLLLLHDVAALYIRESSEDQRTQQSPHAPRTEEHRNESAGGLELGCKAPSFKFRASGLTMLKPENTTDI